MTREDLIADLKDLCAILAETSTGLLLDYQSIRARMERVDACLAIAETLIEEAAHGSEVDQE